MDSYGSNKKADVVDVELLEKKCLTEVLFIPSKTTSCLQPLDVSINAPFKKAMRDNWSEWFQNGSEVFAAKGYRNK